MSQLDLNQGYKALQLASVEQFKTFKEYFTKYNIHINCFSELEDNCDECCELSEPCDIKCCTCDQVIDNGGIWVITWNFQDSDDEYHQILDIYMWPGDNQNGAIYINKDLLYQNNDTTLTNLYKGKLYSYVEEFMTLPYQHLRNAVEGHCLSIYDKEKHEWSKVNCHNKCHEAYQIFKQAR